jgi:predicted DNA-binding protein with PD1-like motif
MYKCFRLTRGMDLKKEIEKYATVNKVSGTIISSVGCLTSLVIRLADGESILKKDGNFEIVSVTGTLSPDGVHIHISVSDEFGNTIGGHLKDGCIVNTTAEVCLVLFDNIKFSRTFDESTGYDELVVNEN